MGASDNAGSELSFNELLHNFKLLGSKLTACQRKQIYDQWGKLTPDTVATRFAALVKTFETRNKSERDTLLRSWGIQ